MGTLSVELLRASATTLAWVALRKQRAERSECRDICECKCEYNLRPQVEVKANMEREGGKNFISEAQL
ncbi:hypothetical protein MOX91_01090 [Opitutales bacterium CLA-KB-P66]|uniref:Secreted protein n=1 Tax=Intestinicryptomonas porci TaxID=2926320 RepID=A0ABU4WE02_9BACT|nr:hypothetical protein [Opitutales bacterium CLA-KB-P66]